MLEAMVAIAALILGLALLAFSSKKAVEHSVSIASMLGIPLAVEFTAIRKKQYEVAIGDAIGSCIIDAGFSIGVGPLLFPITVSGGFAVTTGLYALLVSVVVLSTLALREKLDKKAGVLFIILYLLSYTILYARSF